MMNSLLLLRASERERMSEKCYSIEVQSDDATDMAENCIALYRLLFGVFMLHLGKLNDFMR
jgi:hypothetical protein